MNEIEKQSMIRKFAGMKNRIKAIRDVTLTVSKPDHTSTKTALTVTKRSPERFVIDHVSIAGMLGGTVTVLKVGGIEIVEFSVTEAELGFKSGVQVEEDDLITVSMRHPYDVPTGSLKITVSGFVIEYEENPRPVQTGNLPEGKVSSEQGDNAGNR